MDFRNFPSRARGRYQRTLSSLFFRRPVRIDLRVPCVSFTFDDFPHSSLHAGGDILLGFGLRATYYASLGLMGTSAPTGTIFTRDDLKILLAQGHELGCHTFGHRDAWKTSPRVFEDSIIANKRALDTVIPGAVFESFAYPINGPRPGTKRRAGKHFRCCRAGGQTFNVDKADLNLLKAFFLEKSRDNTGFVKQVIAGNCRVRGWLILATHDISVTPTPYGCTPSFFADVVRIAVDSGAQILPVAAALRAIATSCR